MIEVEIADNQTSEERKKVMVGPICWKIEVNVNLQSASC